MKQLMLTLTFIGLIAGTGFGQFDQEPDKKESTIEQSIDKAIVKVERVVESIDLEKFFNKDLPEFIEEIKPCPEDIEDFENELKAGVERLKEFDASVLDDLKEDIQEGIEDIKEEIEDVRVERRPKKI